MDTSTIEVSDGTMTALNNATNWGNCSELSLEHDPVATAGAKLMFGTLYALVFVFGLLGNGAIILITARNASLQTVQNFFILNLTVADIVVCLLSVPITPITNIYKEWFFGYTLCLLIPMVQGSSIFILTFTLTAIAINRYILILFPHRAPMTRRTALIIIIIIWVLAVSITYPYSHFMEYGPVESPTPGVNYCGTFCNELWPDQSSRKTYAFCVLTAQFIFPSIIIIFCYSAIMIRVSKRTNKKLSRMQRDHGSEAGSETRMTSVPGGTTPISIADSRRRNLVRGRKRTTQILVWMVLVFIVSWLPYQIAQLIFEFNMEIFNYTNFNVVFLSFTMTHFIAMLGIVANPVLYAWLNVAFRTAILRRFRAAYNNTDTATTTILFNRTRGPSLHADENNGIRKENTYVQRSFRTPENTKADSEYAPLKRVEPSQDEHHSGNEQL